MFSNKLFHFFKGYVILYLTGFNIERFLYICARRGITFWNIEKTEKSSAHVRISAADFPLLRRAARKTRTRVHIKRKTGLPFLFKKYRKRYFFVCGFVIFAAVIFSLSQFIWSVEITGVRSADIVQISAVLKRAGIYEGAPKAAAASGKDVKNMLLNQVDGISWAWVHIKGTRAICEVYEGRVPHSALGEASSCNIVAARDGIVARIIATNGITKVSAGDTVSAGDLLISGTLSAPSDGTSLSVAAEGTIEARTWHEKTGTYKLYREYREKTGNRKKYYTLKLFSKTLKLFRDDAVPYQDFDISEEKHELKLFKGHYAGISIICKRADEVNVIRMPIPLDTALCDGQYDLEKRIAEELLPGAELICRRVFHTMTDPETVQVTLTMEFTENIGMKIPSEPQDKQE